MKKPGHSIKLVTSALQGRLPKETDWPIVLEIANRGWLCPALYLALKRNSQLDDIPAPVRNYLSFLHERNCERNRRLQAQLLDAVRALNAAAIEPILLKGAIHLFTVNDEELGSRMISDLDISIAPDEVASARSTLIAQGYRTFASARDFARPDDVGVIELHDKPSRRSARYLSGDLGASSPSAARDGAVARIPRTTSRALHLIVHDMIKEGDYWSFRIDLRHLQDLAQLATSPEALDWNQLQVALPDRVGRASLIAQALALHDLFGIEIPLDLRPGWRARRRHLLRLIAVSGGMSGSLVRQTGNLSRGLRQVTVDYRWRGGRRFSQQVYRRLTARGTGSRL